ncbi:hypothetical protein CRE_02484 [Caenorhabditis remanei]|uniref:DUF19 domain-containing protein n=1 Tax=Caenorhabditis remanei TaxID=31234 RepID=E3MWS4_CAERE|nr:hypothetical protein CRE_02484 [Caenorhabditis remanei]
MPSSPKFLLLLFLSLLPLSHSGSSRKYGVDRWKTGCTAVGEFDMSYCDWIVGMKSLWRTNSIAWWPDQTKNMSYVELKKHCDDSFMKMFHQVCLENTGCYKDFVNYQELDKCVDDVFWLGPMHFCEKKLREVMDSTPDQLASCVKKYLKRKNPDKFDCLSIYEKGQCFLADVEKHCEPKLLSMYKEHQSLRLFNRACDGRLRYKDWDYNGAQNDALQFNVFSVKSSDPKRGILKNPDVEETTDGNNSTEV